MKNKKDLFIIVDYTNPEKDKVYEILKNKKKKYLFLDGEPFCNNVFETFYYRKVWLKLCKNISDQLNMDIAFCGGLAPDTIKSIGNAGFSEIHWIHIVSSEKQLLKRCEISKIAEEMSVVINRNNWDKQNYPILYPQVKLLDVTDMSDELIAEAIHNWILTCRNIKDKQNRKQI